MTHPPFKTCAHCGAEFYPSPGRFLERQWSLRRYCTVKCNRAASQAAEEGGALSGRKGTDGRWIAVDLFCCGGGASMGLHRAGFEVVGVDVEDQPDYPFTFYKADARVFPLTGFDFIWASPPCQGFTAYKRRKDHVRPRMNLIPAIRNRLKDAGVPYVIENVVGAPLEDPIMLCGSMFGLDVRRHRLFEANFAMLQPQCRHELQTPRFPPATNRENLRKTVEVGVWRIPLEVQSKAMGIDWLPVPKLSQAIPPAYSEWLGRRAMAVLETKNRDLGA